MRCNSFVRRLPHTLLLCVFFIAHAAPVYYPPSGTIQQREGHVTASQSTTSSTPVVITLNVGTSVSFTKIYANSYVDIELTFSTNNSSALGATTNFEIRQDGVQVPDTGVSQTTPALANSHQGAAVTRSVTGLAAATYAYAVFWSNTAGTSRIDPVGQPGQEHLTLKITEILPSFP